jgi:hypothetical protein
MNWGPFLFALFMLIFFGICIPAAVVALWFWAGRRLTGGGSDPTVARVALAFAAVFYAYMSNLIAACFGFVGPRPVFSIGYSIFYWQGQLALAVAMVALAVHVIKAGRG